MTIAFMTSLSAMPSARPAARVRAHRTGKTNPSSLHGVSESFAHARTSRALSGTNSRLPARMTTIASTPKGPAANVLFIMPLTYTRLKAAIGELVLTASDTALTGVYFPTSRRGGPPTHRGDWHLDNGKGPAAAILTRAREQLAEYFAGMRKAFDLPLEALGSAFEHRVWNALRLIPYGTTVSYGEL